MWNKRARQSVSISETLPIRTLLTVQSTFKECLKNRFSLSVVTSVTLYLTVLWLRQLEGFDAIAHHRAE